MAAKLKKKALARLIVSIPANFKRDLDKALWDKVQGRIPYGAHREFVMNAVRELLAKRVAEGGRE